MVGQAIEERAGEAFLAECGGPFVERQVRGEDREAFAKELGWPDSASLRAFIEVGKALGASVN